MIKFFRKIRKKLLSENKISRYVFYAIGEIVLVVIGILIALAINNNNEQNKRQNEIADYLSIIKNNISTDVSLAKEIKTYRDSSRYYSYVSLDNIMNKELGMRDLDQVFNTNYNPSGGKMLSSNVNGFNALITSGLIAKIKNPVLRDSIFNYYKLVEELEKAEVTIYQNLRYLNRELFVEVGILELVKYISNPNIISEKQEKWFKDFLDSPHLHFFHAGNLDDGYLDEGYPEIIKRGSYIVQIIEDSRSH